MSSVLKQRLLFQLASMSIYQQKRKCMCNHMPSSKEGINNIGVYIYIYQLSTFQEQKGREGAKDYILWLFYCLIFAQGKVYLSSTMPQITDDAFRFGHYVAKINAFFLFQAV